MVDTYNDSVWVDKDTNYPVGTREEPVTSLSEAKKISAVICLKELIDDIEDGTIDLIDHLWDCGSTTYGGAPKKNPNGIEKHTFIIRRKF